MADPEEWLSMEDKDNEYWEYHLRVSCHVLDSYLRLRKVNDASSLVERESS
jgi:hypothetical protein